MKLRRRLIREEEEAASAAGEGDERVGGDGGGAAKQISGDHSRRSPASESTGERRNLPLFSGSCELPPQAVENGRESGGRRTLCCSVFS